MLILFETAYGYSLFERLECDEIGASLETVTLAMQDLAKFGRAIKLQAFLPFKNAAEALQNMNEVSEGIVGDTLRAFLEANIPKPTKKSSKEEGKKKSPSYILGVSDKTLASSIKGELGIECVSDETVLEIIRGLRQHAHTMLKAFKEGDMEKAQLGLGHSYSRAKVKFNVHRADNMIMQASALLDQMDKDINTFAMRMREWYGWHFPELGKLVADHRVFARLALVIPDKNSLNEESLPAIEEAVEGDVMLAKSILEAARSSMGTDISSIDMINVKNFAKRVLALADYRKRLHAYLTDKMELVAPNLSALIGEIVGARLIAHAGSLTNLSKFPASTVQILGAEKALFRALKTKGKTPKYGLIYHSSFIGKAATKNKGRISRYLANKCAIASRLDCFADIPTNAFGEALRAQVEERLDFYEKGAKPAKNIDVMHKVLASLAKESEKDEVKEKKSKGSKKSKGEVNGLEPSLETPLIVKQKAKKRKSDASLPQEEEEEEPQRKKDKKDKKDEKEKKKEKKEEKEKEKKEEKEKKDKKEAKEKKRDKGSKSSEPSPKKSKH